MIRNIQDPATEPKHKREITISISIVPTEDRSMAATEISAKTKLAPIMSDSGSLMFDFDEKGKFFALTQNAETQGELFLNEEKEVMNGR